ncbi:PadR family transcriptional regulator [Inconstantimicrobium mannanitabidum]|uniref:DNA-binding protein YwzG n=1 Tax=Inconstantimicrobium mannanitabidum TaxID=1604901 RepID=A0ACB5RHL5_9CLOT|nr:helix-turn-helix transcriptional regulator [Clostridium sp. TW13]GKX68557.1 putative DNA-binding protein YwzG [Clostridium sp. TW13]
MSEIDNQLKKGTLAIIVLKLISEKDMYGYEIIQLLDKISEGYYRVKEGTLYPILYRLEDSGWIESYRVIPEEERKIPRKYYRITSAGREALKEQINLWIYFGRATNKALSIKFGSDINE